MWICQSFALENRMTIVNIICNHMGWKYYGGFHTVHNYVNWQGIIRKGAISAEYCEIVLIPINMRDGCIIGRGKGNADWNYSAPHGAGRIMSRSQARKELNLNEYQESMKGIYTTSVNEATLDEAPMAYKSIDEILDTIKDTVEVEKIIKPIYNFKASE